MPKEIFEVVRERFHLSDRTQYIVQGHWPLTFIVRLISAYKQWKNAFLQRIVYSSRKFLHVIMRQTDKLFPLRIIRLVVYSGKRCRKPFEILVRNIAIGTCAADVLWLCLTISFRDSL